MGALLLSMLQEYHQTIISAVWMIILSLIPQDVVWAGAILLSFLICAYAMHRPIEYYQAIISTVWMIILSLILQRLQDLVRAEAILLSSLICGLHAILLGVPICVTPRNEYHQAIISAVGMSILSLIPQAPVRAGAILLGYLIFVRPRNEHHQAIVSAVWMTVLSLIPHAQVRAGAIPFGFLIGVYVMRPRIQYYQAVVETVWTIIVCVILQDPVRAGAILLSFLICVHIILLGFLLRVNAILPRMETLHLRFSALEEKLQDAVDSEILRQSDTNLSYQFRKDIET